MGFFKNLFSTKAAEQAKPVNIISLSEETDKYYEQVLQKFISERAEDITRFATWEMEALTDAINDYKEELAYCKITDTASMCNIFEERIYQLNAAKEILEKKQFNVAE